METVIRANNPLATSLQTLMFSMFVSACVARWLAKYGMGVAVALAWCVLAGAVVSLAIACVGYVIRLVARYYTLSRAQNPNALSVILKCTLSGALAGLVAGSIGFAIVAPKRIDRMNVRGYGFHVIALPRHGAVDATKLTSTTMLLLAAVMGGTSGLACLLSQMRFSWLTYCAVVSLASAGLVGVIPIPGTLIWLYVFGPGNERENMLGLLPLAVPLWCAMFAAVGLFLGAVVALVRTTFAYSRTKVVTRLLFWGLSAGLVLYVTEVGLRGALLR